MNDFPVELPYACQGVPTLYHMAVPGRIDPITLVVRTRRTAPERVARRLREITFAVDPTQRLGEVRSVAQRQLDEERTRRQTTPACLAVAPSVLLLSAAGIHAPMSFTVAKRRKEIGIRTALGAHPRRVLASVFSRAPAQLAAGVGAGGLVGGVIVAVGGSPVGRTAAVLLAVAMLMLGVGLLSAMGPARQGAAQSVDGGAEGGVEGGGWCRTPNHGGPGRSSSTSATSGIGWTACEPAR